MAIASAADDLATTRRQGELPFCRELRKTRTSGDARGEGSLSEGSQILIELDDPAAEDVAALLRAHLDLAHAVTPPGHVHALDLAGLQQDHISFFSARRPDGALLGVGALRDLGEGHFEIKSMHTLAESRGRGVGRAVLEHLIATARANGGTRVSLETGTMEAFRAARVLYESAGFTPCEPFGDYRKVPNSVCMTLHLS